MFLTILKPINLISRVVASENSSSSGGRISLGNCGALTAQRYEGQFVGQETGEQHIIHIFIVSNAIYDKYNKKK